MIVVWILCDCPIFVCVSFCFKKLLALDRGLISNNRSRGTSFTRWTVEMVTRQLSFNRVVMVTLSKAIWKLKNSEHPSGNLLRT